MLYEEAVHGSEATSRPMYLVLGRWRCRPIPVPYALFEGEFTECAAY
jgi:hypothetical protein